MIILISSIPRLINAGCGEVLTAKVPYSGDTGATHLLTESRYMSGNQLDLASLANSGVPVLKPIYLNDFLTSDSAPDLETFIVDDFKPHWETKKRSRITTDTPTNAFKKSKSILGNL